MSFLRTIEIINKILLMMYRKILNYKHIFDIRRKEEGFDFLPDLIAISCVKEKASVSASVTVEAALCVQWKKIIILSMRWSGYWRKRRMKWRVYSRRKKQDMICRRN